MTNKHRKTTALLALLTLTLLYAAGSHGWSWPWRQDRDVVPSPVPSNDCNREPFYRVIVAGFAGAAGERFILSAYRNGPTPPPKSLWLDTSNPFDETVAPYTAPNPNYGKGSGLVDYVYTTAEFGRSLDLHVSKPYGGVPQIGDGIEAGYFRDDVDAWGQSCTGFDFDTLRAYHTYAERCRPDCGPNRGHDGVVDMVRLWAYREPFMGLIQNMSDVFGVPVRSGIHNHPGVLVGEQTGARMADGRIERRSNLKDVARYAELHRNRIHVAYHAQMTYWDIETDPEGAQRIVAVHYTHQGRARIARLKRIVRDLDECERLNLTVRIDSEGGDYCVEYGELYNGVGWLDTVTVAKLSGIGPRAELEAQNITVRVDSPGFGAFQGDLQGPAMVWAIGDPALIGLQWNAFAAFKDRIEAPVLYFQQGFVAPIDLLISPLYIAATSYMGYISLRASATGMVPVISADITLTSQVLGDFRYMIDSLREVMGRNPLLFEQPPSSVILPGSNYTDDQLRAFLSPSFGPQPHFMGSAACPQMVRPDGLWRGQNGTVVEGLRSLGAMDFIPHQKGPPHWAIVAAATKLGCEAALRWGGVGCDVVGL